VSSPPPPATCANCGADIPPGARACPECGADERTGWRETDAAEGLDLPGEEKFDYDDFIRREFDGSPPRNGLSRFWWVTAVSVLALVVVLVALNRFWIAP
jgi:hypothetical protein